MRTHTSKYEFPWWGPWTTRGQRDSDSFLTHADLELMTLLPRYTLPLASWRTLLAANRIHAGLTTAWTCRRTTLSHCIQWIWL